MKRILLTAFFLPIATVLFAQDPILYRTYNGYQNNLDHQEWGAAHTALLQLAGVGFEDGFSSPAGADRPNPRVISNLIFDQPDLLPEPMALSDFVWSFGQFIDHDIGLTEGADEPMNIPIPQGDPDFDPLGFGNVSIRMNRNSFMEGSGTSADNPRQYANEITAFVDGSAVYGADENRANWLRSFEDGKMKVSTGNLLPYNTIDGEFDSAEDPTAPHMADDVRMASRLFIAGDVRANENPLLIAFHTLFVREHNRQATLIKANNPSWDDEQIFQLARKYISGIIQSIVYNEWLPAMGVFLDEYTGYDAAINPQLSNTFTAAAFRVGHTLLNGTIRRVDNAGNEHPQGHLPLRFGFFNPAAVADVGGLEPYIAGMGQQIQQSMDSRVVDDVRNFLFGRPGAGGLDLAAININRGRDRGLPTFNRIRQAYGLRPYYFLEQISGDLNVYSQLIRAYGNNITLIDPWVGMLAEDRVDNGLFGETITTILGTQFQALRDGDRFFYLNDPVLTADQQQEIHHTTLKDVIVNNTDVRLMQDNVFLAMPFDEICESATSTITGSVNVHWLNTSMANVQIDYFINDTLQIGTFTNSIGTYTIEDAPACEQGIIRASYEDEDWLNGVSTQDIVYIARHVLNINRLVDPFQLLAADANDDGNINVNDIIAIRRLILGLSESLPGDRPMWNFVPANYTFNDPQRPWNDSIPDGITSQMPASSLTNLNFVVYKRGDVSGNATVDEETSLEQEQQIARNQKTAIKVIADDIYLEQGEVSDILFDIAPQTDKRVDYQFALTAKQARILEASAIEKGKFLHLNERGELRFSNSTNGEQQLFKLRLKAQRAGYLSDIITIDETSISAFALLRDDIDDFQKVALDWRSSNTESLTATAYPNPFHNELHFDLPIGEKSGLASLTIYNLHGQKVKQASRFFDAGSNTKWTINTQQLVGGQYSYRIVYNDNVYSGLIVAVKR